MGEDELRAVGVIGESMREQMDHHIISAVLIVQALIDAGFEINAPKGEDNG